MKKRGEQHTLGTVVILIILAVLLVWFFIGPNTFMRELFASIKDTGEKATKLLPTINFDDLTESEKDELRQTTKGREKELVDILKRARELRAKGTVSDLISALAKYREYLDKTEDERYKSEVVGSEVELVKKESSDLEKEICKKLLDQGKYAEGKGAVNEAKRLFTQAKDIGCDVGTYLLGILDTEDKIVAEEKKAQLLLDNKDYDGAIIIYRKLMGEFKEEDDIARTLRLRQEVNIANALWYKNRVEGYKYYDTILSKYPLNSETQTLLQVVIDKLKDAFRNDPEYKKLDFTKVKVKLELRNVQLIDSGLLSSDVYQWTPSVCEIFVLSNKDEICLFTYHKFGDKVSPTPEKINDLKIDREKRWLLDYTFYDLAGNVLCSGKGEESRYGDRGITVFVPDFEKNCGDPRERKFVNRIELRTIIDSDDIESMEFKVKRSFN